MNEEDVPNMLLSNLHLELRNRDTDLFVGFSLNTILNDPGIRDVDVDIRQCRFQDEVSASKYKYYSFSACVTECVKEAQLRACGCAFHHLIYDGIMAGFIQTYGKRAITGRRFTEFDDTPVCNYTGLTCLDTKELIFPRASILQPWNAQGDNQCACYPSCADHEIKMLAELHGYL